jgi:hypothetical protein
MTTRVKSLLSTLDGGGEDISNFYTIISHEFTTAIPILPSFSSSHHHSHAFTRKTYSAQKLLLNSLMVYFTQLIAMGGSVIRYEPTTIALLEHYPVAYQNFLQAGWLGYFQRLQWYDQQQVLQFAQNLQEDHSIVQGVQISVTEEDIVQVSGLPTNGICMFSRKHIILNAQQDFLFPGEQIEPKGWGVRLSSLPPPWPEVAKFFKHYLTCEGRYQVVYHHDFVLLSHLRHNRLVNIPYYLLGCLKNMSHYCKKAKNPALSLTHHRLIQLLIQRGFPQQNLPLNNPPIDPQEDAEIPENLQEQQPQNPPDSPEIPNSLPTTPISPINPLPYQSHPTLYQNHPLLPFIFLVMILSQKILPAPSLRKNPHRNERKFLSFRPFYKENKQGPQQGQPLLPLP